MEKFAVCINEKHVHLQYQKTLPSAATKNLAICYGGKPGHVPERKTAAPIALTEKIAICNNGKLRHLH